MVNLLECTEFKSKLDLYLLNGIFTDNEITNYKKYTTFILNELKDDKYIDFYGDDGKSFLLPVFMYCETFTEKVTKTILKSSR